MDLELRHAPPGSPPTRSDRAPGLHPILVPVGLCATSAALTSLAWALLGSDTVTRKAGLAAIVLSAFAAAALVYGFMRAQAARTRAEVHAIEDRLDRLAAVEGHQRQPNSRRRRRRRGNADHVQPASGVPADLEAFLRGWQSPELDTDR